MGIEGATIQARINTRSGFCGFGIVPSKGEINLTWEIRTWVGRLGKGQISLLPQGRFESGPFQYGLKVVTI